MSKGDMKVHDIRKLKNILLPRFDAFGDIVLLQGFIQALLNFLPEARITLLVREGNDQLETLFPARLIWKTTSINSCDKASDLEEIKRLLAELRKDEYDLLIMTTYNRTWLDDILAAALTSPWRIAHWRRSAIERLCY
jgi:ADP-heptose:LPS heptosyltransferase